MLVYECVFAIAIIEVHCEKLFCKLQIRRKKVSAEFRYASIVCVRELKIALTRSVGEFVYGVVQSE